MSELRVTSFMLYVSLIPNSGVFLDDPRGGFSFCAGSCCLVSPFFSCCGPVRVYVVETASFRAISSDLLPGTIMILSETKNKMLEVTEISNFPSYWSSKNIAKNPKCYLVACHKLYHKHLNSWCYQVLPTV